VLVPLVGHRRTSSTSTALGALPALLRLACAMAVLATLAASCGGPGEGTWGSQNIAIALVQGQPTLLLYTCQGGNPITSVALVKHDIHADTDEVLWQVTRVPVAPSAAERMESLTIGQSAVGYRILTPLNGTLPTTSLDVELTRSHLEGIVNFKTSQLNATKLRVDQSWFGGRRSVDMNKFMSVNRKNC